MQNRISWTLALGLTFGSYAGLQAHSAAAASEPEAPAQTAPQTAESQGPLSLKAQADAPKAKPSEANEAEASRKAADELLPATLRYLAQSNKAFASGECDEAAVHLQDLLVRTKGVSLTEAKPSKSEKAIRAAILFISAKLGACRRNATIPTDEQGCQALANTNRESPSERREYFGDCNAIRKAMSPR